MGRFSTTQYLDALAAPPFPHFWQPLTFQLFMEFTHPEINHHIFLNYNVKLFFWLRSRGGGIPLNQDLGRLIMCFMDVIFATINLTNFIFIKLLPFICGYVVVTWYYLTINFITNFQTEATSQISLRYSTYWGLGCFFIQSSVHSCRSLLLKLNYIMVVVD